MRKLLTLKHIKLGHCETSQYFVSFEKKKKRGDAEVLKF